MNPELDSPPFQVPKVDLYLELEKLAVGISKAQYQVTKLIHSLIMCNLLSTTYVNLLSFLVIRDLLN